MTTDITLAAAGYMLAPGTYERVQDGMAESRSGRAVQTDFFGGQRRAVQLERDASWSGLGVGPALGGQGVTPWPDHTTTGNLFNAGEEPSGALPWAVIGDEVYFASGSAVYRSHTGASGQRVFASANAITDLCSYNGNLLLAHGTAADIGHLNVTSLTEATLLNGEKGQVIAGYAGFAMWAESGNSGEIRMVTGSGVESRFIDGEVIDLVEAGAKIYAVTREALYHFTGRVRSVLVPNPAYSMPGDDPQIPALRWSGEWTPFYQGGAFVRDQDYGGATGYGGSLYVWLHGRVLEHKPESDRAGWRDTGLSGTRCWGMAAVAGYLWVAITALDGAGEVWAWDGSGWWRVLSSAETYLGPMPNASSGRDLTVLIAGQRPVEAFDLAASPSLPAAAEWVSSLIHANAPDRDKAWRKIGAVFAAPVDAGTGSDPSADDVTVSLDYTLDGGETWTAADTELLTEHDGANLNVHLDAALASSAAVSRHLQLRVSWTSVSAWAPVLTAAWAEYELLEAPARRRRWRFVVDARDRTADREGVMMTRDGQELIDDLWSAWSGGTVVSYTDIDGAAYQVRIIGISTKVANPDRAGVFGDAAVKLELVEL